MLIFRKRAHGVHTGECTTRRDPRTASVKVSATVLALSLLATAGFSQARVAQAASDPGRAEHPQQVQPLTAQTAQQIADGDITLEDGTVDTLLFGYAPLNPDADDDVDGLTNAQEIGTYTKNGVTYLHYNSHPQLPDTDGDGLTDKQDSDPLDWNVAPRDAIIGQELVYRDDDYIRRVLDGTRPLEDSELYKKSGESTGRLEYRLMNREWGPYWQVDKTYHLNTGFDAVLFKFANKTMPFLKKGTYILAIRGTAGGADVRNDAALGLGTWPAQASDAVNLANEIWNRREEIQRFYVTGHSLGGYLSQIFLVRSLGGYYGDRSFGFTSENLLRKDPSKLANHNLKGVYTFNSPKIVANWLSPTTMEYAKLNNLMARHFNITNYVVANDSVSNLTGAPENATRLPASAQGHSSRSFFEKQYSNVPGFTVGRRGDLSGSGYQDPLLPKLQYVKLSRLTFTKLDGTKVVSKRVALNERQLKAFKVSSQLPEHYELVADEKAVAQSLQYGQDNQISIQGKPVDITYTYALVDESGKPVELSSLKEADRKALEPVVIHTRYDSTYTVPELPVSSDPDYRFAYVINGVLSPIPPDQLTESRTINLQLKRVANEVTTSLQLVDEQGHTVKTVTYTSKPSQSEDLSFNPTDLPEGYEVAPGQEEAMHFKPGSTPKLNIRLKRYQVTYRYEFNGRVLKEDHEQVVHGSDSTYTVEAPENYVLADPQDAQPLVKVTQEQVKVIQLKEREKNVYTVRINYVVKNADGSMPEVPTPVQTQELQITEGEHLPTLQAPTHPEDSQGKHYHIDESFHYDEPITESTSIVVPIIETVDVFHATIHYLFEGREIAQQQVEVLAGQEPVFNFASVASAKDAELYKVQEGFSAPKIYGNVDVVVPLQRIEKPKYTVQIVYTYTPEGGKKTVVQDESVQITQGEALPEFVPPVHPRDEHGVHYTIAPDFFVEGTIDGDISIEVPLVEVYDHYEVTVNFVYDDQTISTKTLKVRAGDTPEIVYDGDAQYHVAEDFQAQPVYESGVLTVPLVKTVVEEQPDPEMSMVPGEYPTQPKPPVAEDPGPETPDTPVPDTPAPPESKVPGDYPTQPKPPVAEDPGPEFAVPGDYPTQPKPPVAEDPGPEFAIPGDYPTQPALPVAPDPGAESKVPDDYPMQPPLPDAPAFGLVPDHAPTQPPLPIAPDPGPEFAVPGDYPTQPKPPVAEDPGAEQPSEQPSEPGSPESKVPAEYPTQQPKPYGQVPDVPAPAPAAEGKGQESSASDPAAQSSKAQGSPAHDAAAQPVAKPARALPHTGGAVAAVALVSAALLLAAVAMLGARRQWSSSREELND